VSTATAVRSAVPRSIRPSRNGDFSVEPMAAPTRALPELRSSTGPERPRPRSRISGQEQLRGHHSSLRPLKRPRSQSRPYLPGIGVAGRCSLTGRRVPFGDRHADGMRWRGTSDRLWLSSPLSVPMPSVVPVRSRPPDGPPLIAAGRLRPASGAARITLIVSVSVARCLRRVASVTRTVKRSATRQPPQANAPTIKQTPQQGDRPHTDRTYQG
jgi:hypothetical protein